jgi:hypothetical protein
MGDGEGEGVRREKGEGEERSIWASGGVCGLRSSLHV